MGKKPLVWWSGLVLGGLALAGCQQSRSYTPGYPAPSQYSAVGNPAMNATAGHIAPGTGMPAGWDTRQASSPASMSKTPTGSYSTPTTIYTTPTGSGSPTAVPMHSRTPQTFTPPAMSTGSTAVQTPTPATTYPQRYPTAAPATAVPPTESAAPTELPQVDPPTSPTGTTTSVEPSSGYSSSGSPMDLPPLTRPSAPVHNEP